MNRKVLLLLLPALLLTSVLFAQEHSIDKFQKRLDADISKFTDIGNIGLTVTNFGMYGHGFSLWPEQPNCEFPLGSGIEHIFDGGLWIGGYIGDVSEGGTGSALGPFVSTATVDAASVSISGGGSEYTTAKGSQVVERSAILDSPHYSPQAVSHQDFVMNFTDSNTTYLNGEPIVDHNPLGVTIHQETYAWNYPFSDFFVIMNYWIKNVSDKVVDSAYVALWTDTVVRNTNITSPRVGSPFFNKSGNGFSDSLNLAYEFDATGDVGFTDSYIGIQYLGSSPNLDSVNFVSWQFQNTDDPNLFAPQNDIERYSKMNGWFDKGQSVRFGNCESCVKPNSIRAPSNRSVLISAGPFRQIQPGDSVNIVFALTAAKKYGQEHPKLDTEEQKTNLYANASWALRAYRGEDANGNGVLDEGEDNNGSGKLDRYILPSPPQAPKYKVIPKSKQIDIYWSDNAEASVDPITNEKDFEGYRIYKTNAGFDLTETQDLNESLNLVAEFDSVNNDIGYNLGFSQVKLNEPKTFPNDPIEYNYKFTIDGVLNGWQYAVAVTGYDRGDPENNITSLETSKIFNISNVVPGTEAQNNKDAEIGVYPNPYYGEAYWDGSSERLRKIYFYNLPERCEITVYTLAGDVVKTLNHTGQNAGSNIRWFDSYSITEKQVFAGGEHAWDLITDNDQAIASGLYLYTVEDLNSDDIKRGKFLILK